MSCFSRVCSGGVLGARPLQHTGAEQGQEGARHQIPAQEDKQVHLLLQEGARQSLGECLSVISQGSVPKF